MTSIPSQLHLCAASFDRQNHGSPRLEILACRKFRVRDLKLARLLPNREYRVQSTEPQDNDRRIIADACGEASLRAVVAQRTRLSIMPVQ